MDDRKRRKDDLIKELVRLRTKVARLNKALSRTTITNLNTKIGSREKRMEESLRQSKKFHRSIMQTALDGIWINNLEGQILDLNQAYCKMTGYSRDELLKMSISDIEAKKNSTDTTRHTKQVIQQGYDRFESRHRRKDGKIIDVEISARYLDEGKRLVVFIRDITKLKKATVELNKYRGQLEQMLRERTAELIDSEKKYRNLYESNLDGIILVNIEGRITEANEVLVKMLGYTKKEILQLSYQELTPPEWAESDKVKVKQLHEHGYIKNYEKEYYRKNGIRVPIDLSVWLIKNTDGNRIGMWGIVRDITERKKTEEKLKTINKHLQHRTLDLEGSNKELEQFAYVASHDLQEPLRMISSYTQLLAQRYKTQLDEDARDFLKFAMDGANRMQKLINDLLTYSRLGTRGKPLKPIDCHTVLGQTLANLRKVIQDNHALVTNDDLPTVMADEAQLVQLFQNFISNAIRFHSKKQPRIHISAEEKDEEWIFSIQDNGIGIESEFKDRIFVIFQKLHSKEKYPGTGMGLAICRKIAERHGGRIWFDSVPDKGSIFYFAIPKKEE